MLLELTSHGKRKSGFSSCTEKGAVPRGHTVPAQGGVPASPGDSFKEGVCVGLALTVSSH